MNIMKNEYMKNECPNCGYKPSIRKRSLADELKDEGLCRLGELLNEGEVHELVMLAEAGKLFNKQGNRL